MCYNSFIIDRGALNDDYRTLRLPMPCGKGVSAEAAFPTGGLACWQFGEYPPCCRRNAEGYHIGRITSVLCLWVAYGYPFFCLITDVYGG